MKRFVEGEDRRQSVLLPAFLDDYVSEENPVRVIDVFTANTSGTARAVGSPSPTQFALGSQPGGGRRTPSQERYLQLLREAGLPE